MPPPASPVVSCSVRSFSLNDHPAKAVISRESSFLADGTGSLSDSVMNGRSPQDKMASLLSGTGSSTGISSPRPESSAPFRTFEQQAHLDRLQSRLEALEYENNQLRSAADCSNRIDPEASAPTDFSQADQVEAAMSRISLLEIQLQAAKCSVDERDLKIVLVEQTTEEYRINVERQMSESETHLKEAQLELDDSAALVKTLQATIEIADSLETESKAVLEAKDDEIKLMQAQLEKAFAAMEDEKRELGSQIDELRQAGQVCHNLTIFSSNADNSLFQETIALYEERLNTADASRYELEDKIVSLEARNGAQSSPSSSGSRFTSAAQIDNETLRDQVRHLQKKIGTLEDAIEDRRSTSDKEEAAVRERMKRMKDKEDAMKRELNDGRKEVERMLKLEANARERVQEIEEAFRESTLALENARAEVEGLRAELAVNEPTQKLEKS
jgi:chromosome segregation ATPase